MREKTKQEEEKAILWNLHSSFEPSFYLPLYQPERHVLYIFFWINNYGSTHHWIPYGAKSGVWSNDLGRWLHPYQIQLSDLPKISKLFLSLKFQRFYEKQLPK